MQMTKSTLGPREVLKPLKSWLAGNLGKAETETHVGLPLWICLILYTCLSVRAKCKGHRTKRSRYYGLDVGPSKIHVVA